MKKYLIIFLFSLTILQAYCQVEQFKLEAHEPGIIEQALLNQAIDNDIKVKELDKKLNQAGFVRDVGNLGASSLKCSVRILNLNHYGLDRSARFVTNGINLGADALNVATVGYKIYKAKKIKKELEERINIIKLDLFNAVTRLANSRDDIDAKSKLISLVGETSANDYLKWLEINPE